MALSEGLVVRQLSCSVRVSTPQCFSLINGGYFHRHFRGSTSTDTREASRGPRAAPEQNENVLVDSGCVLP